MNRKLPNEFYPVTPTAAQKLRKANLTASEWKIWSYLIEIDPWGDRYEKVDTLELLLACDVSKATYYRAIAKFQDEKIFDFQDNGFNIRNLHGIASLKNEKPVSKMRQIAQDHQSQNCEKSLNLEKKVSEMRQLSQNCENQPPEVAPSNESTSPQISSDLSDYSDRSDQDDFLNFENNEAALCAASLTPISQTAPQQIDDSSHDRIDGLANMPTDNPTPIDGDLFRRAVEDFVLKSLKFSPRDRTAYFSRFTPENWQDWEAKYKATLAQPSSMYKPFTPEKVKVADPNSPEVQKAIAEIRESLRIKP
jgi:hypothetical protein